MAAWPAHEVTEQNEEGKEVKSCFRLPADPTQVCKFTLFSEGFVQCT